MAIYIVAVQMSGGQGVEHIIGAICVNESFSSGESSLTEIINFIDENPGQLKVSDGETVASVEVVRPRVGNPYIRSQPDSTKTDNLLALPRYN